MDLSHVYSKHGNAHLTYFFYDIAISASIDCSVWIVENVAELPGERNKKGGRSVLTSLPHCSVEHLVLCFLFQKFAKLLGKFLFAIVAVSKHFPEFVQLNKIGKTIK